ncbi:MAG TPA: phosphate ABC transporter permease subunit PstC [Phycisphaerales bacterium]|nr:phosphate ABC transporter permease subunit PstC [Phycisphaerales bacterium]
MNLTRDRVVSPILFAIASFSITALFVIGVFIFVEGLPVMLRVGVWKFIGSSEWLPLEGKFGILAMIVGSITVAVGTLVVAVPLGVGCAVYLSEFASKRAVAIIKPSIELLFAIPSVVYGFIGVLFIVPFMREHFGGDGHGFNIVTASFVLGIMVLPVIVGISVDALQAVPKVYRDGSLALGATQWQTTTMVTLKAARSGILAGVILGMANAIGETMAVIMVVGNAVVMPNSPLDSVRTLTGNIALEMGYATGDHRQALFATGVVLLVMIMMLNTLTRYVTRKRVARQ